MFSCEAVWRQMWKVDERYKPESHLHKVKCSACASRIVTYVHAQAKKAYKRPHALQYLRPSPLRNLFWLLFILGVWPSLCRTINVYTLEKFNWKSKFCISDAVKIMTCAIRIFFSESSNLSRCGLQMKKTTSANWLCINKFKWNWEIGNYQCM